MHVVIVDSGQSRGALAAARALRRRGAAVTAATPAATTLLTASRATVRRRPIPSPEQRERFRTALPDAVGDADVVLVGADDYLAACTAVPEAARRIPAPAHDHVRRLLDKDEVAVRAPRHGLRTPEPVPWDGSGRAPATCPVIVKPRDHATPPPGGGQRLEAVRADDPSAAAAAVARITAAGARAVLQEVVEGQLMAVGVLRSRSGRVLSAHQQIADRIWPLPTGITCRGRTVPVDRDLLGRVDALLDDLSWYGLVEAQFLAPPAGRPVLIDLNGRLYGSLALAEAAGAGYAWLLSRLALQEEPEPVGFARAGVRYSWLEGDLRRAWREGRGGRARDLGGTLVHALTATHSIADVRDPRPGLHQAAVTVRRVRARRGAPTTGATATGAAP